jgi:hypothetical protein
MNTSGYMNYESVKGDCPRDTALLKDMFQGAREFIQSYAWCQGIKEMRLGYGVGGIVAVFYIQFEKPILGLDESLWVIYGDTPSAYLVTEDINTPYEALKNYCSMMDEWTDAVLNGKPLDDVFPVDAVPNIENARELKSRIEFIRKRILNFKT